MSLLYNAGVNFIFILVPLPSMIMISDTAIVALSAEEELLAVSPLLTGGNDICRHLNRI